MALLCAIIVCQIANTAELKAYVWVKFLLLTPNYLFVTESNN